MVVQPAAFREALGQWASGVTVVTSRAGGLVHGMTVSAFSSVSLEPPLVLVCADKTSDTYAVIQQAGFFAVNVLSRGQQKLSDRFALEGDEDRRFEGLETRVAVTGAPLLPGCVANLDCSLVDSHDAGDHVIFVGRVEAADCNPSLEPLLYCSGAYRGLR